MILKLSKKFYDVLSSGTKRYTRRTNINFSKDLKNKIQYEFGNVSKLDLLDAELVFIMIVLILKNMLN